MLEGQTAEVLTKPSVSSLYNVKVEMIEHNKQPICLRF